MFALRSVSSLRGFLFSFSILYPVCLFNVFWFWVLGLGLGFRSPLLLFSHMNVNFLAYPVLCVRSSVVSNAVGSACNCYVN